MKYHPVMRVSKIAEQYLAREPLELLTPKQAGRALQIANRKDPHFPQAEMSVEQLQNLFVRPPNWLKRYHEALTAKDVPG